MPKKMSKADKAMITAVIVIAVLAVGVYLNRLSFKTLAIIPELDNRILYWDKATDDTQALPCRSWINMICPTITDTSTAEPNYYESNKFIIEQSGSGGSGLLSGTSGEIFDLGG